MRAVHFWVGFLLCNASASAFQPSRGVSLLALSRSSLESGTRLRSREDAFSSEGGLTRRQVGELAVAASGTAITVAGTAEVDPTDYGLWGIVPVGTYKRKKTVRETIVPGQLWTFDQKFGILNVQVPLRMTVIKLKSGGLFVYNPIAATREMVRMVRELADEYGPVKYIAVGSVALEHKAYASVFAQKFRAAKIFLQPGQYSFPLNLPNPFLGFPPGRTFTMPRTPDDAPEEWRDEFDWAILGPIISRDGAFGETVFHHKASKTLLVTDTTVQATDEVPPIYETDPSPLLYHARDTITDVVQDTPETRKKGWKRVVLFGLFFMPSAITVKDVDVALKERRPDINSDFAGVYPWDWTGDVDASWKALTGNGKPLVAPILQTLLLNRSPVEVLDFADKVASWPFTRIIPAHLKNDLAFKGSDYRKTFGFLEESGVPPGFPRPLDADLQTLRDAEVNLVEQGAIAPAPPKVGGKSSRAEIVEKTLYRCRKGICTPKADV